MDILVLFFTSSSKKTVYKILQVKKNTVTSVTYGQFSYNYRWKRMSVNHNKKGSLHFQPIATFPKFIGSISLFRLNILVWYSLLCQWATQILSSLSNMYNKKLFLFDMDIGMSYSNPLSYQFLYFPCPKMMTLMTYSNF